METAQCRPGRPSGAMTLVLEARGSGAGVSVHPRSGEAPEGLGGVGEVTLLLGLLGLTDSWLRRDKFSEGAAKELRVGKQQGRNTADEAKQAMGEGVGTGALPPKASLCQQSSGHRPSWRRVGSASPSAVMSFPPTQHNSPVCRMKKQLYIMIPTEEIWVESHL